MESCQKGNIDYLLITKWDRFSRNAEETLVMKGQLKAMGVEVNCTEQWVDHDEPNELILFLINNS